MKPLHQERRAGRRYPLKLSLVIPPTTNQPTVMGSTKDVSTSGMFFYTDFRFAPLSTFDCSLILPDDIAPLKNRVLACNCQVVRVEEGIGTFGVAAKFTKITFSGESWNVTRESPRDDLDDLDWLYRLS
jgi:hypothetical protein